MKLSKRAIDETGNYYGKLYVVEPRRVNERGTVLWWCRCECGEEKEVSGNLLRAGKTTSCGCRKRLNLNRSNKAAKKRKYTFLPKDLVDDDDRAAHSLDTTGFSGEW